MFCHQPPGAVLGEEGEVVPFAKAKGMKPRGGLVDQKMGLSESQGQGRGGGEGVGRVGEHEVGPAVLGEDVPDGGDGLDEGGRGDGIRKGSFIDRWKILTAAAAARGGVWPGEGRDVPSSKLGDGVALGPVAVNDSGRIVMSVYTLVAGAAATGWSGGGARRSNHVVWPRGATARGDGGGEEGREGVVDEALQGRGGGLFEMSAKG